MKKRTIWIVFSALLACLTCVTAAGCEVTMHSPNIYSYKNAESYSAVAFGEEKTLSEIEEITSLDFEWIVGEVEVSTSDTAEEIKLYEKIENAVSPDIAVKASDVGEEFLLRYAVVDKILCVRFAKNNVDLAQSPFCGTPSLKKTLFVILPKKHIEKTKILSVSSSVAVDGVVGNEITVNSVSGRIATTDCSAENMVFGSVSGALSLENCAIGNTLKCNTVSGKIATNACSAKEFDFNTTSGAIEATNTVCKKATFASTSGGVSLSVPKETLGFTVDYSTTSGTFSPSVDVKKAGDSYVYGDGSVKFIVRTTSGNLTLTLD